MQNKLITQFKKQYIIKKKFINITYESQIVKNLKINRYLTSY